MQECNCITEPFLSKSENGSVVFYRGKPLYSQYAPARSVLQVIDSTVFQPRTLVLLASPVLDYGIRELLAKLGEHSYVLAVQPDDVLYNFSMQHLTELHFSFLQTDLLILALSILKVSAKLFRRFSHSTRNSTFRGAYLSARRCFQQAITCKKTFLTNCIATLSTT